METKSVTADVRKHWTGEVFLTRLICDLVEGYNHFHVSQINVLKFLFGRGPQGRSLKVQLCHKAVTTADCFMPSFSAETTLTRSISIKRARLFLLQAERLHLLSSNLVARAAQRTEGNQRFLDSAALVLL